VCVERIWNESSKRIDDPYAGMRRRA